MTKLSSAILRNLTFSYNSHLCKATSLNLSKLSYNSDYCGCSNRDVMWPTTDFFCHLLTKKLDNMTTSFRPKSPHSNSPKPISSLLGVRIFGSTQKCFQLNNGWLPTLQNLLPTIIEWPVIWSQSLPNEKLSWSKNIFKFFFIYLLFSFKVLICTLI